MKKRLYEARVPLKPGEEQILKTYHAVAPAMRQSLDFLRQKNPNATMQQAAQQLLSTPQFQGNQQLSAISQLKDQDVKSSGQVARLFAQNPVQKVVPPPPSIMNQVPAAQNMQKAYGYDPIQYSQTIEQERTKPENPEDVAAQQAELRKVAQDNATWAQKQQEINQEDRNTGPIGMRSPQRQKGRVSPPPGSSQQVQMQNVGQQQPQPRQQTMKVSPNATQPINVPVKDKRAFDRTMKVEAFNFQSLTGSLQKIMKAVSSLRPEELQMLLKMLNSMIGGQPQSINSVGQTSMTRSTMNASKKYTQKQLIENLKKDILKEELIVSIKSQAQNYKLVESLLKEGPFSNVWQGLKNAGTSIFNKVKSLGDKTGLATGQVGPDEQAKAYSTELMKVIKKAHQTRQQFKSQVLKNAEIINAYHEAVSQVWNAFSHVGDSLGPHAGHIKSQVDELVSNLKYDLESEKEQISSFLKVLGDLRGTAPDSSMARGAAEFKRNQEAEAARRMKNPITGKRYSDSAVDPAILQDTDKELVADLVKKAMRGDKQAMDRLRDIQAPKMKAAIKADRAKKAAGTKDKEKH